MTTETAPRPAAMTISIDTAQGASKEQIRLLAADLILRVLALVKKKEPKKALARLVQLNALCVDHPTLKQQFTGINGFLSFGRFYCTNPTKIKRKAIIFMGLKATPVLDALFKSLESYLVEQRKKNEAEAEIEEVDDLSKIMHQPKPSVEQQKLKTIGSGLEALKRVMPNIIEAQEKNKAAEASRIERAAKIMPKPKKKDAAAAPAGEAQVEVEDKYSAISSDDAYVLELSGKTKIRELESHQSAVIRASVVLTHTFVSEIARRNVAVDFGMQRVLGNYLIMSEALVAGVARYDEYGNERTNDDIRAHARRLVAARNAVRARSSESIIDILYAFGTAKKRPTKKDEPTIGGVKTLHHTWFLLFTKQFITDGEVSCQRWEFYRKPGTADVALTNN